MAADSDKEFALYLVDMFSPLGKVTHGRLFGGYGLKAENVQFAMFFGDELYMRADEGLAARLKNLGAEPFTYETRHKTVTIGSYYSIPGELLDDPDQMLEIARASLKAAMQAANGKKPKKKNMP